jgi:hypothetical protein
LAAAIDDVAKRDAVLAHVVALVGPIKRVALAVGDGATVVRLVHEHLREDHPERAVT